MNKKSELRIEVLKSFMVDQFRPKFKKMVVREVLNKSDLYRASYGSNSCRQTSIYGSILLDMVDKSYTWTSCEAMIQGNFLGNVYKTEHAWTFGHSKKNGNILIDLECSSGPVFKYSNKNVFELPRKVLSPITKIDKYDYLNDEDIIFNKKGIVVLNEIVLALTNEILETRRKIYEIDRDIYKDVEK